MTYQKEVKKNISWMKEKKSDSAMDPWTLCMRCQVYTQSKSKSLFTINYKIKTIVKYIVGIIFS